MSLSLLSLSIGLALQVLPAVLLSPPTMGMRGLTDSTWHRAPPAAMGLRELTANVEAFFRNFDVASRTEQDRLHAVQACVNEGKIAESESEEIQAFLGPGSRGSTLYGEITQRGFTRLATRLKLGPGDDFADLGSGTGKSVVQAVDEFDVTSSHGVEISATRHKVAVAAMQALDPAVRRRVSYSLDDCCSAKEWADGGHLHNVSVVWTCSTLFGRRTMLLLRERLSASRVRLVASQNQFPGGLEGFVEEAGSPEMCEMSWTLTANLATSKSGRDPGAPVYIYRRASGY